MGLSIYSIIAASVMTAFQGDVIQDDPTSKLPPDFREALMSNGSQLQCFTSDIIRQRRSDIPIQTLLKTLDFPSTALDVFEEYRLHLERKGSKFRCKYVRKVPRKTKSPSGESIVIDKGTFDDQILETSSDGTTFYNGNPNIENPVISLELMSDLAVNEPDWPIFDAGYFAEAGYYLPSTYRQFAATGSAVASSELLHQIRDGASEILVTDEPNLQNNLIAVHLSYKEKQYDYEFDKTKNFAQIRRRIRSSSGELISESECTDFEEIREGFWMPKKVIVNMHSFITKPNYITKNTLYTELYVRENTTFRDIEDERFVLRYDKPGTFITDNTLPGGTPASPNGINFRAPANPADLDDVSRAVREAHLGPLRRRRWIYAALVVNAIAAVVFVVFRWRKKRSLS